MFAFVARHLQVDERAYKPEPRLISTRSCSFANHTFCKTALDLATLGKRHGIQCATMGTKEGTSRRDFPCQWHRAPPFAQGNSTPPKEFVPEPTARPNSRMLPSLIGGSGGCLGGGLSLGILFVVAISAHDLGRVDVLVFHFLRQGSSAPPTTLPVRSPPSLPERSCPRHPQCNAGLLDRYVESSKMVHAALLLLMPPLHLRGFNATFSDYLQFFSFLDCPSIVARLKATSDREQQLTELMRRANEGTGGFIVNAIVHQDDINTARPNIRELRKAAEGTTMHN